MTIGAEGKAAAPGIQTGTTQPGTTQHSSGPRVWLWTLENGLQVAYERRAGPGFALDLRIPVGSAHDPVGFEGSAGVLEEWLFKGAGGRSARALQDAFDDLGVRRGGGVGPEATRYGVSGLKADLPGALALLADVLLRPDLPDAELAVLLDLARQDLEGLEDSPPDLLAVQARSVAFDGAAAAPFAGFAHPASGTPEGLATISPASLREFLTRYGGNGSVLGLVADADPDAVHDLMARTFADWRTGQNDLVTARFLPGLRSHLPFEDGEQTHISLSSPGIAPLHPHWLHWQLAITALSGGSASRLFHAVREERGLAYSVSASPVVLGGQGFLSTYAGSTPARAPETLDVLMAELGRLPQGLTNAEFIRAKTGLTASVVFGAESLRARATSLTRDVAVFGRIRSVADLRGQLAALTLEDVNAFLSGYDPAGQATTVTLGPVAVEETEVAAAEVNHV
ncbi:pitrilysin family protein [Deinococcus sp. QL22]|uniref:M16 family metallopeptidase n=1 Tax=Deinococcus sp. QL22 TaxID=2939437 RepID=UPI002016D4AC|nr:pitrilysin family protein [Deinococcus sp. QL22]UQN07207.1 insulinase family protein [Deinococcus sp. QL22]